MVLVALPGGLGWRVSLITTSQNRTVDDEMYTTASCPLELVTYGGAGLMLPHPAAGTIVRVMPAPGVPSGLVSVIEMVEVLEPLAAIAAGFAEADSVFLGVVWVITDEPVTVVPPFASMAVIVHVPVVVEVV
jgi:hypothetical protein